ncbi:MAG: hypothetical protein JWO07_212 [Candidatus Saccharibacteria bacterium]|nr:hypothetical protein [Candidatus Saccharibacteria bacterium]
MRGPLSATRNLALLFGAMTLFGVLVGQQDVPALRWCMSGRVAGDIAVGLLIVCGIMAFALFEASTKEACDDVKGPLVGAGLVMSAWTIIYAVSAVTKLSQSAGCTQANVSNLAFTISGMLGLASSALIALAANAALKRV